MDKYIGMTFGEVISQLFRFEVVNHGDGYCGVYIPNIATAELLLEFEDYICVPYVDIDEEE